MVWAKPELDRGTPSSWPLRSISFGSRHDDRLPYICNARVSLGSFITTAGSFSIFRSLFSDDCGFWRCLLNWPCRRGNKARGAANARPSSATERFFRHHHEAGISRSIKRGEGHTSYDLDFSTAKNAAGCYRSPCLARPERVILERNRTCRRAANTRKSLQPK